MAVMLFVLDGALSIREEEVRKVLHLAPPSIRAVIGAGKAG
jgi:hypothetical protein